MDLQYLFSSLYVRYVDVYLSVKSARTHKSRVEYVGSVCRRHNYNAFVLFKAVHLHKQLVEGLFSLVVSAAETRASLSAHGVYLVNEYDTRHILLCLIKEVSHSRRTGTYKHLYKVTAAYREERHVGFACDRLGKQRLARTRRSYEQYALRYSRAKL